MISIIKCYLLHGLKILFFLFFSACSGWKNASRDSAGIAPDPNKYEEAIVQVYAAKLWGFRGLVADHTWISTKKEGSKFYTVYEVLGWLKYHNNSNFVLSIKKAIPDRFWFGNKPKVLLDLRDEPAKRIIDQIHTAAINYPYKRKYALFGPNSNTFTAWIACKVPELKLRLSARAIGKNFLKNCN